MGGGEKKMTIRKFLPDREREAADKVIRSGFLTILPPVNNLVEEANCRVSSHHR
jgi:hypothetical protein